MRLTVDIEELAPGGDGVAIVEIGGERRAVFARGTCAGDRAVLDVDPSSRPARGRIVEIVAPSADRVSAPCAYVDRCGGCDWMHVATNAQARHHEAIVRAALPEAFRALPIVAHPASATLGYRTRARVHARASGGRAIVGMNEAKSHEPLPVDQCIVLDPALDRARALVAPLLEGAHGRGDAQIALGSLDPPRKPVLDLHWTGALPAAVYARLERGVAAGEWAGARVFAGDVARPATIGDPTPWMQGADGAPLRLPPGGFAQAAEAENVRLATRVAELAASTGPRKRLELFAGAGNLSVLLARQDGALTMVESDRAACDAARKNLAARGLSAKVVEADAETYGAFAGVDLLILDPPRTGARGACAAIASKPPKHVLYVSCDPQTLGRDLRALEGKVVPRVIETFEMFPGTSHVETVVLLERRRG